MGEKSSDRIAGGAGALAALATVGALFAGAGLVGDGVGSLDLWPDWTGSPRPSAELAARSPNGSGVNPLLPLTPRTDGIRSLGSATAALVLRPTAFSAGPDIATAGLVAALAPLTEAPASGAVSARRPGPGAFSSLTQAVVGSTPAAPSAPADQPAPAAQAPPTPAPTSEPARRPSGSGAPPPAEREQVASAPPRDQSSRPSSGSGSGSDPTVSAGAAVNGRRPDAGHKGSAPPPSGSSSGTTSSRPNGGPPPAASESAAAPPPAASASPSSQPARAEAAPGPPPAQGAQSASTGGGGSTLVSGPAGNGGGPPK